MTEFEIEFQHDRTQVRIGSGAQDSVGPLLAAFRAEARCLVVSDGNVAHLYAGRVTTSLASAGLAAELHVVPPGDESKVLAVAGEVYDRLAAGRYGRDCFLVAVGGGMVSDLTGFVAATWMRGVDFAICPTTLEADIDACIGGKTAVNHPAGKNLIGVFHQPRVVLIDPACLESLSQRDLVAGLAESVKHAVIRQAAFLEWHRTHREAILARDPQTLETLIEGNVRIKAEIVAADERERSGARAVLNFGHTIGHALEAWSGYRRRHGECVALGMVAACRLSVRMGLLDGAVERSVVGTLAALGLPTSLEASPPSQTILDYIAADKKAARQRVRYVLLADLGRTVLRDDVPEDAVIEALDALAGG